MDSNGRSFCKVQGRNARSRSQSYFLYHSLLGFGAEWRAHLLTLSELKLCQNFTLRQAQIGPIAKATHVEDK